MPALDSTDRQVVLVVDDDQAVLNSLRFSLEIEGFRVLMFRSGKELLDARELPRPACLVVDYNLPGLNGLDLIAELKRLAVQLPAILITSHPPINVRLRAAAAGVAIVEKPLLTDALVEAIRQALSQV